MHALQLQYSSIGGLIVSAKSTTVQVIAIVLLKGFDKAGFHGGTPPSSFGLNVPGGTQTGTPGAGPAMYSGPFMPVMGHPNHSQILHHTMVAQVCGSRFCGAIILRFCHNEVVIDYL